MRYKEFNRNAVLEKGIPLFWKNGFAATPISALVEITGVNRFSLYNEFENKEGILHDALDLYFERYAQPKLDLLDAEVDITDALKNFLNSYLVNLEKHPPGCFCIYIGTEMADSDVIVKEKLDKYINTIESCLKNLLNRDAELKAKSDFLKRQLSGLFCSSVSFCLIHTPEERIAYIDRGIKVILNKVK